MINCKTRDKILNYLKKNGKQPLRKIQRDLKISSVSVVHHHIKKIEINYTAKLFDQEMERLKDGMTERELIKAGY